MFWPFLAIIKKNLKQEERCIKHQCVSSQVSAVTASVSILHMHFGHKKMQKPFHLNKFCMYHTQKGTRMAIRYGLNDLGIESWWGARFSAPSKTGMALTTHPHLAPRLKKE